MDDQKKLCKKKQSTAQSKFTRIYNQFQLGMLKDDTQMLQRMLEDLEPAYCSLEEKHTEYVEALEPEDEEDQKQIVASGKIMETTYGKLVEVRSQVASLTKEGSKSKSLIQETTLIKVKKLDAPSFGGDLTEYPSFMRDYKIHMEPVYGKDPYALRKCLHDEALLAVRGVDDNFDEMKERLDNKYGRPDKFANAIVKRLKGLKPVLEDECYKFIELVDTVEQCWLEMKRLDMEGEMNNVTMVTEIEKLLPRQLLREWCIQKDEFQLSLRKDQFSDLLKFLIREKRTMEYINETSNSMEKRNKEVRTSTHALTQETEGSDAVTMLLKRQQQNDATLNKVVEGLTQLIESVRNPTFRSNSTGNQQISRTQNITNRTSNNKCWFHKSDNHEIITCSAFQTLDSKSKSEALKKNGACFCCLQVGHISRQCLSRKSCDKVENGIVCNRFHHPLLHQAHTEGNLYHVGMKATNLDRENNVILMISTVFSNLQPLTVFWDPGSNTSLITKRVANSMGLRGKPVTFTITTAGNVTTTFDSKEYKLPLTDLRGHCWIVTVYEMREVTGRIEPRDLTKASSLFSQLNGKTLIRPSGAVDVLIGTDCAKLLPKEIAEIDNLQLMHNQFGYCLRGSHHSFGTTNEKNVCQVFTTIVGRIRKDGTEYEVVDRNVDKLLGEFLEVNSLGTSCNPKCGNCRCGKCPVGMNNFTIKEGRELNMIENGLTYDSINKQWTANYPWVKDRSLLLNNFLSAFGCLKSQEKRLMRTSVEHAKLYDDQIRDMVERRCARKIDLKELCDKTVHYITHHEVMKASKSTPMRVVFNSSMKYMGQCLNDFWAKGPCMINDLFAILLRFREELIGIAGDISKMFNAVKLSLNDQYVHLFLWRNLSTEAEPDHYALTTVTFGDKPSPAIAMSALRKTAAMFEYEQPRVYELVDKNSFVDDLITSCSTTESASKLMQDTENVLKEGGFKIKQWVVSGSPLPHRIDNEIDSREEKVLGMLWKPELDCFAFKISINFSKHCKNISHAFLSAAEVRENTPQNMTYRMVLSIIASIFDPLGLISPVILRAKVLMRTICSRTDPSKGGKWDALIENEMREEVIQFFLDLFDIESLSFSRCIRPVGIIGNPILIIFSDGGDAAYGAVAYIRWQKTDGSYVARLLTSKNRIAPKRKLTVPRLEMCGAVVSARLRNTIVNEMNFTFERVLHLVDSSIVRAQIQKDSYGFATFVALRIGEIQSLTDPTEWWWIPSEENPADMVTRVCKPSDLSSSSTWQNGPCFLAKPIEEWPISKDIGNQELPDRNSVVMTAELTRIPNVRMKNMCDIVFDRFNNFEKLIKVTAMILKIARMRSFKGAGLLPFKERDNAEKELVRYIQLEIPDWKSRYQRLGPTLDEEGIIVVGTRMSEWLRENWNSKLFILLPCKNRFTELYAKYVHETDHAAPDTTIAKIRSKYWICRCGPLVKRIKKECIVCRGRDKQLVGQIMAPLPTTRLQPSPPFSNCAVDFFGPITIRDTVKKRSRSKGYGALFTDLVSRACHIEAADSCDTGSFVNVLRRFHAIRGVPKTMLSDSGTNFVATTKEFENMIRNWDWDKIYQFGDKGGTVWTTTKSADAPWENGCCEAMVKQAKRNLMLSLGTEVLSILELQTLFYEVANLLNQRPIGTKTKDPNQGCYLCPNDLILGRATSTAPSGYLEQIINFRERWHLLQRIATSFWKKWMRDYFHSLILRPKWHTEKRNLQVGDVVLVRDSNVVRGVWKLAQVGEVFTGRDNKVRDVSVRYKNQGPGGEYKGVQDTIVKRSAHRLVLLLPVEEQEA